MIVNVTNTGGRFSAKVHGRPELYGEGSSVSTALRELAKAVEYVGDLAPDTELTDAEKRECLSGDRQLAAISLHRRTAIGFADALRKVEEFIDDERTKRLNESDLPQLDEHERVLALEGHMLAAVKRVKERLGIGLKEAKDAVDKFCAGTSGTAECRGGYRG